MQPYARSSFVVETPQWNMGYHAHETLEISIVLEGKGVFEHSDSSYPIEAGHVVIVPALVDHTYRAMTDIRFGVLEAGNMPAETALLFTKLVSADVPSILYLPPIAMEQYETLFRQWLRTISQPLKEETRFITAWVDLLILFLLQHNNSSAPNKTVAATADHIRSNLKSEVPIAQLARQCSLSESAYRSLFKEAFGVSPKQYQQACRASEAKWLLRATNKPIQTIAEQVGFSGVHSFSSWFQKIEGVSPSEWRKAQQRGL